MVTEYEAFADKTGTSDWRVEAFGSSGECYVAIFCGPCAQKRAENYARWMNAGSPSNNNSAKEPPHAQI